VVASLSRFFKGAWIQALQTGCFAPVAGSIGKALRWFCICDLRLENPLMAGSFKPPGVRVVIDSGSRFKTAAPNSVRPVTI
jgi:hypothetical protein